MIDVLVPVLSRPHRAVPVFESLVRSSETPLNVIFLCTEGDDEQISACWATDAYVVVLDRPAGHGDFAKKINLGFELGEAPFVFLGADDLEFQPGWDLQALALAETSGRGVIGTNDDFNPTVIRGSHSTHSLVRRSYIEEYGGTWHDGPGIVYSEAYHHQFVDTELCAVARERGQWAFAPDSHVSHHHPFYDHSVPRDATYEKALSNSSADRLIFQQRLRLAKRAARR